MPGVLCHSLEILDRAKGCTAENAKEGPECSQNHSRKALHWQLKTADGLLSCIGKMWKMQKKTAKK